jgi:hypothetical protein
VFGKPAMFLPPGNQYAANWQSIQCLSLNLASLITPRHGRRSRPDGVSSVAE